MWHFLLTLKNISDKKEIRKCLQGWDFLRKPTNKLKMIEDLNVRPETIKLLEENIGRTLPNINHSKILYDPPHRVKEIKTNE